MKPGPDAAPDRDCVRGPLSACGPGARGLSTCGLGACELGAGVAGAPSSGPCATACFAASGRVAGLGTGGGSSVEAFGLAASGGWEGGTRAAEKAGKGSVAAAAIWTGGGAGATMVAVPVLPSKVCQWNVRPSLVMRKHCGSPPNQTFHL